MPKKSYNRILDEHLHILIAQGNHEAYQRLKKCYHLHALSLCSDVLLQYPESGVSRNELMVICDDFFPRVVIKFNPALSSFYSFWKEITLKEIMDYMIDNSYGADAFMFRGHISFDQENDRNGSDYYDILAECNDNYEKRRIIFEIRGLIARNRLTFTSQEKALLILLLEGYSFRELEHNGAMSRASLYLTFNKAIRKLKKCIDEWQKNNRYIYLATK